MENEYFASINEVSKRLSVPAHTLRYWEKQFPNVIRPTTGAGGRRYYRPETVNRLVVIQDLLYNHGMTIAGVKKLLHDGNFPKNTDEISLVPSVVPKQSVVSNHNDNSAEINSVISMLARARDLLS